MHCSISANMMIQGNYHVLGLGMRSGLPWGFSVYDKETDVVDGLATSGPVNRPDEPPSGNIFWCINQPIYNCLEKLDRAGAMCSLCRNLNRGMALGLALPFGIFNIQYTVDDFPARGPSSLPGDGYDCVYAGQYGCVEKVEKVGTICSKCRAAGRKDPTLSGQQMYLNNFYAESCAEYPLEDAEHDEATFHS